MSKILVSGSPGQAAFYLARDLSEDPNNKVYLGYRYSSTPFEKRFEGWEEILERTNVFPITLDITDQSGISDWVKQHQPDKIFNAAALSHVGESFKNPQAVFDVNTAPVISFLEAIRQHSPDTQFLQFSTSEMYGSNFTEVPKGKWFRAAFETEKFQDEDTPLAPNSPYAAAKVAAHNMVKLYRESYGLDVSSIITFNMESERRGENFVTRKITKWIAGFVHFLKDQHGVIETLREGEYIHLLKKDGTKAVYPALQLGNIYAFRDWSYCGDSMKAAQMIIGSREDYVVCSEQTQTVAEFLELALREAGLFHNINTYYVVNPQFFRPCEVEFLKGSSAKIRKQIGWEPEHSFDDLVKIMVESDIEQAKNG